MIFAVAVYKSKVNNLYFSLLIFPHFNLVVSFSFFFLSLNFFRLNSWTKIEKMKAR